MGKKQIHIRLDDELWEKLKMETTDSKSLNSVIVEKLEASVAATDNSERYLRASAASLGQFMVSNNLTYDSQSGLDSVVAQLSAPTTPWKGNNEEQQPEQDD